MKILFICTLNAVRSPMAESLAKQINKIDEFHSAGLIEGPQDYFAIEVMNEIGIDISGHKIKTLDEFKNEKFDKIICLSDEVKPNASDFLNKNSANIEYWDIPSPGKIGGNRIMKLFGYREIRDSLRAKIRSEFA